MSPKTIYKSTQKPEAKPLQRTLSFIADRNKFFTKDGKINEVRAVVKAPEMSKL